MGVDRLGPGAVLVEDPRRSGGPSWKPFPVFFTTIFGLFGHAAPNLWLVVTRTASLLALVAAFRLGRRFAGPLAGIVAVLALCLTQDWMFYVARGASEPVVAALTLWAIDRHLNGSPRVAFFLAFLATLNRPEFSAFLALYAVYLWMRVPGARPLVVGLLILIPIAWLGPPKIITGNAFQAGSAALGGKGSPGTAFAELRSSAGLMGVPTLVFAAVGLVFAYIRREKVLLWLGAAAIAWALMVAIITQVAYGLPRYLLPGGVIACVLAGVGVVWLAEAIAGAIGARRRSRGWPWRRSRSDSCLSPPPCRGRSRACARSCTRGARPTWPPSTRSGCSRPSIRPGARCASSPAGRVRSRSTTRWRARSRGS